MDGPGPIATHLRTLRPEHRARYKAEQIAGIMRPRIRHISPILDITVRGQPWTVIIKSIRQADPPDDDAVILQIEILDQDEHRRPFSNPWILRNPPVMVPTGALTPAIDDSGETVLTPVYTENPIEALRQALEHTIAVLSAPPA